MMRKIEELVAKYDFEYIGFMVALAGLGFMLVFVA